MLASLKHLRRALGSVLVAFRLSRIDWNVRKSQPKIELDMGATSVPMIECCRNATSTERDLYESHNMEPKDG